MRVLNDEEMTAIAGGQAHSVAAHTGAPVKVKSKTKAHPGLHALEEEEPVEPGDGGGGDGGGGDGGSDSGGEHDSGDTGSEGGDDPVDPNASGETDGSATDGNAAAAQNGIDVKPGADITNLNSKITDKFGDIKDAFANHTDNTPVITSGNDSTHMEGSLHYTDNAIDMRANNISAAQANAIVADLKSSLGGSYFVQYETFANASNNHIHIQYNGH